MKKLLLILALSAAAHGATHTAASCQQADVATQIAAATYGDTVYVPSGIDTLQATDASCFNNWPVAFCIRKGLHLIGGYGGGTTTFRFNTASSYGLIEFYFYEPSANENDSVEFANFTIEGIADQSTPFAFLTILNYNYTHTKIIMGCKIHDCIFKNINGNAISINGPVCGCCWNCTFDRVVNIERVEGGSTMSWPVQTLHFGTDSAFYFEDNTILASSKAIGENGGFTSGQGGSIVSRYNVNNMTNVNASLLWNAHGLQSMSGTPDYNNGNCSVPFDSCYPTVGVGDTPTCREWATVKAEYYGNIVTNLWANNLSYLVFFRGRQMLCFDNLWSGSSSPGIQYGQYSCDNCESPAMGYSMHIQNTYIWANTSNGTIKNLIKNGDNCADKVPGAPYTITENRDFFNYNPSFNGSAGIGCGTYSQMMAITPSTVGVGFWVTDYPNPSKPPSTMDSIKSYIQSGVFYKCTSKNVWIEYYHPYTYPHPLRGVISPVRTFGSPIIAAANSAIATIRIRGAVFTIALPVAVSIRSPELTIIDISGRTIFRAALGAVLKKVTAEGVTVFEYMWQRPIIAGIYYAIVKEAACNGASVMARAKIVVGRQ